MIGLLILGQKNFADGLIESVAHTFGARPAQLEAVAIDYTQPTETIAPLLRRQLARVDTGHGVLILADLYGATHTNIACRLVERGRVELIAGVNLPMLLRVLNYRDLGMTEVVDRALAGGCSGIVCGANPAPPAPTRDKEARP